MRRTARRYATALAGSAVVRSGDRFANRFFFVRPAGGAERYDKRHLFSIGGEDAIETQCYVVGVNRTGDDPWNHYAGDSAVVDFKGTPLCEADASEGVFTAQLDREALDRFRTKFPAWRDADDFLLR